MWFIRRCKQQQFVLRYLNLVKHSVFFSSMKCVGNLPVQWWMEPVRINTWTEIVSNPPYRLSLIVHRCSAANENREEWAFLRYVRSIISSCLSVSSCPPLKVLIWSDTLDSAVVLQSGSCDPWTRSEVNLIVWMLRLCCHGRRVEFAMIKVHAAITRGTVVNR